MKLGIMQPYFFPYIGYWQLIKAVDSYIIYDDVNFINRGWISRNNILINGQSKMVNLQLENASQNKMINEIKVLGDEVFQHKLLRTFECCYHRAPYYSKVYPIIEDIIKYCDRNLATYLENSIRKVCDYLSIKTKIILSSSINKNHSLRGQDKILEICRLQKADIYINAIGGQELYSFEDFKANNIELFFLKPEITKYRQFKNDFVKGLSIIDVMMFNSIEEINVMLERFELKGR